MKKIISIIAILFIAILIISSCEKDDLCSNDIFTTPSLVMDFFDLNNPDSPKNVFKFRVQGEGNENVLEGYNVVTANSVALPLKTTENSTRFLLHKSYAIDDNDTPDDTSDDTILGNQDIITITYETEQIYVSRACGYKTIFKNVTIIVNDDDDKWIDLIQPINDNQTVEYETAAHFNLFH